MQILRIGNKDVLVFFDPGANQHLIDGNLAEELNLCVLRESPINIGTAGGGSINSGYGRYAVNIGPDEEGFYHELLIQGVTEVTRPFPTYDLSDINLEVAKLNNDELHGLVLPEYVGGSRAHIIIGVKNTGLYPTLITKLDSGLGIFKSPFTDKFGSNIAYGGPHSTFSKNTDAHHIDVFNFVFNNMVDDYVHSPCTLLTHSFEPELIGVYYEKDLDIDVDYVAQTEANPTAVSQRIYSMVKGDESVRNNKVKNRKLRKIKKLVDKGVYDPQYKVKKRLNRILDQPQKPCDLRDKLNDGNRESSYQEEGSETFEQYRIQSEQACDSYSDLHYRNIEYPETDYQYRDQSEKVFNNYSDSRGYGNARSGDYIDEWRQLQEERRALKEEREDLEREWEAVKACKAFNDPHHDDYYQDHYYSNPRPGHSRYNSHNMRY